LTHPTVEMRQNSSVNNWVGRDGFYSYSASHWSSYTLFVRTSHLDSASEKGVVNTPARPAISVGTRQCPSVST